MQYYGHPPSTYELISDNKGPSCRTDREITESSECKEAADGLGLDYNDVFTVDSFSHTPCGCFLWDAGTDGVVDKLAFNEGDTCTTTSRALGMICKTEVSQIPPRLLMSQSFYTFRLTTIIFFSYDLMPFPLKYRVDIFATNRFTGTSYY